MKNSKDNTEKTTLHPRNPHRFRYDFEQLISVCPDLKSFVFINEHNPETSGETIDFANPDAVKNLNKAILISNYDIQNWDIPANYLCPPIPGRADYIHYIADYWLIPIMEQFPKEKMLPVWILELVRIVFIQSLEIQLMAGVLLELISMKVRFKTARK